MRLHHEHVESHEILGRQVALHTLRVSRGLLTSSTCIGAVA